MDQCYSQKMFDVCYKHNVSPLNGQDMWPPFDMEMLTQEYKIGPRRPKKHRREVVEDPNTRKLIRKNTQYKCTRCDAYGHNSRGCTSLTINPKEQLRKV